MPWLKMLQIDYNDSTQMGGIRPYGVGLLVAGVEKGTKIIRDRSIRNHERMESHASR